MALSVLRKIVYSRIILNIVLNNYLTSAVTFLTSLFFSQHILNQIIFIGPTTVVHA